ncbi:MAG: hypothetical protein SWQ30_09330 [Thermodesulfobacteriota bacterium]|nr:hypothetical protein [Thermodesulfobacteriota bacterium]
MKRVLKPCFSQREMGFCGFGANAMGIEKRPRTVKREPMSGNSGEPKNPGKVEE